MVNFFKGTKDRASFFLSPRSGHHTKSRMILINYDVDGKITSEGWCIFQDDVEADAEEVGTWKYYTSQGVKTVNESLKY